MFLGFNKHLAGETVPRESNKKLLTGMVAFRYSTKTPFSPRREGDPARQVHFMVKKVGDEREQAQALHLFSLEFYLLSLQFAISKSLPNLENTVLNCILLIPLGLGAVFPCEVFF
jgi:hypothetical protein